VIRFIIVIAVILVILLILRSRSKNITNSGKKSYRIVIISLIVIGVLILVATSGRYILPQLLQIIKVGLPFLTKFIGI